MKRRTIIHKFNALAALIVLALAHSPAQATGAAAAVPRVGIVLPKAQLGQGNTGQDVAEPVRQLIFSYMAGPVLELVPLQARVQAQIDAEARQLGCTHVLYTTVEQKKGKKGLGGLMKSLGPAASMLPAAAGMGGDPSSAMIAGAASSAMSQAAMQSMQEEAMASLTQAQAGAVKKKDEITLAYEFVKVDGGNVPLKDMLSAKAETDGEDLLSPLIEQLANAAITAATAHANATAAEPASAPATAGTP